MQEGCFERYHELCLTTKLRRKMNCHSMLEMFSTLLTQLILIGGEQGELVSDWSVTNHSMLQVQGQGGHDPQ